MLDRTRGGITHASVRDLPRFLDAGDLLVANDTRVFPARLLGRRVPSGGVVECLLLSREAADLGDGPRTVRATGVAARWRTFTSMPTLTKPFGRCEAIAAPDAISICRIIIGVA